MIALVDYGMGNLRSVQKALQFVGGDVRIVRTADELMQADRMVLPGVGAFADCMKNLAAQNLTEALKDWVLADRPFLGICLGYQALFQRSEEGRETRGLGIFEGEVVRFPYSALKVPQIGWNQIRVRQPQCPLLRGVSEGSYVYFVHSYYPVPAPKSIVCTETDYGGSFASMVWKGNVFACQFHPEKSQRVGLQLLENFVKL